VALVPQALELYMAQAVVQVAVVLLQQMLRLVAELEAKALVKSRTQA